MTKLIKSALYVRMSTDDQEASPEQQRESTEAYAAEHGYTITHRYEDLGVSGDRTDKRFGFQRMIADGTAGAFNAILCWDQDRFGRFDMIEAGRWIYPLRQAGIHLATVTDGRLDWESMAGRLVYSVKQEGKNQFLRDLSKNVTRGMNKLASQGKWVSGVPPFGYVVDEDQRLQLSAPEDVALVQSIFRRYIAGESLRQLSQWMSEAGITSPKGSRWTATGLAMMLKNERYLGYLVYNQRTCSKYKSADNPTAKMKMKPRDEWLIVQNTHPPIVTQAEFNTVQELMTKNTRKTCPNPGEATALSGLLKCGHCGQSMFADRFNNTASYTCYSYRERPGECERYNVTEQVALREILKQLRVQFFDKYLTPSNVERIKAAMREKLSGTRADATVVQSHLSRNEVQLNQAKRRLIEVDVDMVRHVTDRIRELEDMRETLLAQLDVMTRPADVQIGAIEERINAATAWLSKLEQLVDTDYSGQAVNTMLRQFIDKVELNIERVQWGKSGKRFKSNLIGGTVFFRLNGLPSGFGILPTAVVYCEQVPEVHSVAIRWGVAIAA